MCVFAVFFFFLGGYVFYTSPHLFSPCEVVRAVIIILFCWGGRKLWLSLLWLVHLHKQCKEGVDGESPVMTGQSDKTWLLQMSAVNFRFKLCPATENPGMLDKQHTLSIFSLNRWLWTEGWTSVIPEVSQKPNDEWIREVLIHFSKRRIDSRPQKRVSSSPTESPERAMAGFSNGLWVWTEECRGLWGMNTGSRGTEWVKLG